MPPRVEPLLCVFCRRQPVDPEWRPFCSKRCKIQDLGRWADGTYSVPAGPEAETDPQEDEDVKD